jgi:N-acetylneuraminate synthase/N,N'-diacetyllegionaminate synthase
MLEISRRFDCLTGLSDHTQGTLAAVGAAMLGGVWIEKHFTSDRGLPGPDHHFSSDPGEFARLVRDVRAAEQGPKGLEAFAALGPEAREMIGSASLQAGPEEEFSRRNYRLSCVAARALPAGHRLRREDIAYQRPGTGWRPSHAGALAGRTLRRAVGHAHMLREEDFE